VHQVAAVVRVDPVPAVEVLGPPVDEAKELGELGPETRAPRLSHSTFGIFKEATGIMTAYMPAAFNGGDYAHDFQAESEAFDDGHQDFTTGAPRGSFRFRGPVRMPPRFYNHPTYPRPAYNHRGAHNPGAYHRGAHHQGALRPPQGGVSADYLSKLLYNAYHHPVRNPVQIAGMPKKKKKQKKRSVPLDEREKKAMTAVKTLYLQGMEHILQEVKDLKETRQTYLKKKKMITLKLLKAQND
jgi:hypothetical protein